MGLMVADSILRPTNILCDNQATLCSVNNDKAFGGNKYMHVKRIEFSFKPVLRKFSPIYSNKC
jgi:hypothetical protein